MRELLDNQVWYTEIKIWKKSGVHASPCKVYKENKRKIRRKTTAVSKNF